MPRTPTIWTRDQMDEWEETLNYYYAYAVERGYWFVTGRMSWC